MAQAWVAQAWVAQAWVAQAWVAQAWVAQAWVAQAWVAQAWVAQAWVAQAWVAQAWVAQAWVAQAWVAQAWVAQAWGGAGVGGAGMGGEISGVVEKSSVEVESGVSGSSGSPVSEELGGLPSSVPGDNTSCHTTKATTRRITTNEIAIAKVSKEYEDFGVGSTGEGESAVVILGTSSLTSYRFKSRSGATIVKGTAFHLASPRECGPPH